MNNIFGLLNLLKGKGGGMGNASGLLGGLFSQNGFTGANNPNMNNNNNYANNNNAMNNQYSGNFSQYQNHGANNYQQQQQSAPKQYNSSPEYPYGEFPYKYTKAGQEKLKEDFLNRGKIYNNDTFNTFRNTSNDFLNNNPYNQGFNNNNYPNFNNGYIQNTQNNSNTQTGSGLDINTLLPLLGNLSGGKNNDVMKSLLPLLSKKGGSGNFNMEDILKLISNNKNNKVSASSVDEKNSNSNELPNINDLNKV